MGCNCNKKKTQPTPQPIVIPQTPEELHAQEMNKWNGGVEIKQEDKKEEDGTIES